MKRFILTVFLAVGALAVFSATGNAQISRRYSANIPFDFSVGKRQFKAGNYTIGPLGTQTSADFLLLTDRSTGKVKLIGQATIDRYNTDLTGKMNFVQAGDVWVLSSIETGTFSVTLPVAGDDSSKIASNKVPAGRKSIAIQ
jgi:hypothetical protein